MAPNIVYDNCNDCDCDEKVKRAYWNCLAFLVYNELKEKELSVIQDIQKLMVCLRESLDKWKTIAYDRAQKRQSMRNGSLAFFPPFDFQNGGRRIKNEHVIEKAAAPLFSP